MSFPLPDMVSNVISTSTSGIKCYYHFLKAYRRTTSVEISKLAYILALLSFESLHYIVLALAIQYQSPLMTHIIC